MAKVGGAKFISPEGGSVVLSQVGSGIVRSVNDAMQQLALEVQKRAREYVPVDKGNAEKAIKVDNENRRRTWSVYLDMNQTVTDGDKSYPVGDYIIWLHEGQYNLGPKSLQKESTLSHGFVGRKFLERAFHDVATQQAMQELTNELRNTLKQRSAAAALRRKGS